MANDVRIRMASGSGLDRHVVLGGAFDEGSHIVGIVWPGDGHGFHVDVQVVAIDPGQLIQRVVGVADTVAATIADVVETGAQRGALAIAHGGEKGSKGLTKS